MFLAFVFWIGCKWIKKGGLCARGWENREPFFIDLLWGKQVLKTHKIPLVRWGALDWVGETTSAKRSYLKQEYKKAICLSSSPDGSDTVFNGQREHGNQECPSLSLLF